MSIIAFALTVGYSSYDNIEECFITLNNDTNISITTIKIEFEYPFHSNNFDIEYLFNRMMDDCQRNFDKNFNGGAQFFVATGILSMLYSLGILPVYIAFLDPKKLKRHSKWIANAVSRSILYYYEN